MSARTRGLASLPSFSKMPRPLATRMEKATSSPRAPDAATAVAHARRSSASSALDFAMAPRAPPPHPGRAPARRRSEEGVGRGGRGDRLVVGRDGGVGSGGKVGGLTSQINFFVLRTVAAVTSCWVFLYIFYRRQTPARWEEKRGRVGGEERSRRAGGGGLGPGLVDLVGLAVEPEVRDTEHGASPFYST